MRIPDSPEGIALALACEIMKREEDKTEGHGRNCRPREEVLDLYKICLKVVTSLDWEEIRATRH